MRKTIYFENLDGLRFLCFLSVFFFHSFHTDYIEIKNNPIYHFVKIDIFGNGNLGVNFFFVLSGFLITFLLLEEKKTNGKIALKNFWIRRVLRIWPLFYFSIFFGFTIFPFLKQFFGQTPNETANLIYYLTFLNNFDFIKEGLPDASILGVLWSVAIEEQFYLIWPVILFLFPVKNLWIPFSVILISSLTFRAFNDSFLLHEHHTLSCIGDMIIGAIGAWLISTSEKFKRIIENLNQPFIFIIYIIFIVIFFFRDNLLLFSYEIRILERSIIAVFILLIILEQSFGKNSVFKISNIPFISQLGRISYGLYCLHFIGILVTTTIMEKLDYNNQLWQVLILETFIALMLTIIISWMSYRFYERPFLELKERRFSYVTR